MSVVDIAFDTTVTVVENRTRHDSHCGGEQDETRQSLWWRTGRDTTVTVVENRTRHDSHCVVENRTRHDSHCGGENRTRHDSHCGGEQDEDD
ncbi:hypothetical protein LSAT2_003299 [Lamellibrachia satsuma]|nr:hypothetical protein LSAT2_003299 [Lamellibrachia satsuma]